MAQWSVPELGFRPLVTIQRLVECSDGIELHRWGGGTPSPWRHPRNSSYNTQRLGRLGLIVGLSVAAGIMPDVQKIRRWKHVPFQFGST